MTIEELKNALEQIPPDNALNEARRRAIVALINRLMEQQGN